jgi:glycosyltransferase involved in cell wall biosynthesis
MDLIGTPRYFMNIRFIRHSVLSRGGDKIVLAHAGYLAERGHDVAIVTNKIDTVFPINPKIKTIPMPLKGKLGTLLYCLLKKQSRSLLIADIIVLAVMLALRNGKRVVYFAQDYDESYYRSSAFKMLIRCIYFFGLTVVKIPTIAVSEKLAIRLSVKFNAAVNLVANGVDISTFFPETDPALLQEKEDRKAILLLSRKDRRKGFDLACIAVAKLAQLRSAPFEVWTVGEPAAGMFPGIRHRHFGYADEKKLRTLFSSADVFLYPSRHEGFGLMVMESFACRCPVVTTEAVPFAENGINALVSMIEDPDALASHAHALLDSDTLRKKIIDQASVYATANSMQKSHNLFEQTLVQLYSPQMLMSDAC